MRAWSSSIGLLSLLTVTVCGIEAGSSAALETGNEPIETHGVVRWASVSASDYHACALTDRGRPYCWGLDSGTPRRVVDAPALASITVGPARPCEPVNATACMGRDRMHACGLDAAGLAYCWGDNSHGQLGDGTTQDREGAVRAAEGLRFQSISAGDAFTCAVSTDDVAYCWGYNGKGNLGLGSADLVPHALPRPMGRGVKAVAAGVDFACGVDAEGTPFCWGEDYRGRLGSDAAAPPGRATAPVPVNGVSRFMSLSAGQAHACGIAPSRSTLCWGSNADGELGSPKALNSLQRDPVEVDVPGLTLVTAGSGAHTCGIAADGTAWCWGSNEHGQLGRGVVAAACEEEPCHPAPAPISGGERFHSLAVGKEFTCGVTHSGELLCWGRRPAPTGSSRRSDVPVRVGDP